ncbi:MAG TPA: glycosyltransferase family 9 protein [Phycisphaerales bacterium]|nr:glycosyltransferase family 9 protein [Phycisphaerales bacterium]
MPSPQRVLIIRPSALGDVCRSVPVLASMRRAWPGAVIDWLVRDTFADAVRHHPALSGVVEFPRSDLAAWWRSPGAARRLAGFQRGLARRRYELVLDCQGLARSALFAAATRAPRRVGYADARELGWLWINERVRAPRRSLHAVDRALRLVEHLGVEPVRDLRLYPPPAELDAVRAEGRAGRGPYAVLAPTSRWPGKRWRAERFAELARRLLDRGDVSGVLVVGGAGERAQCGPLLDLAARDARVVDLVGRTSVGGLMAIMHEAALVVANDSAALHMAVGLGRPLVGLYGPTDAALVGPYGREASVLQVRRAGDVADHKDEAAGRAMMDRIPVDAVLEAAGRELACRRGAPSGPPVDGPRAVLTGERA